MPIFGATNFIFQLPPPPTVVQNHLADIVLCLPWSASATDARHQLHRLQIIQRIAYKIATVTFRVRQTGQPPYLYDKT